MLALGVSDAPAENTFCILMEPPHSLSEDCKLVGCRAGVNVVPKIALQFNSIPLVA
jgi:hypothetical protein